MAHTRLPQLAQAELWSLRCHLAGGQVSRFNDAQLGTTVVDRIRNRRMTRRARRRSLRWG
ncbi:hypothetical protein [Streptomyces sp. 6N223]|uniref:hypothetical protein n=1 Tax=Streptomyces sp. 6N223 TaxID=3457412 RepID=UPI003FD0F586